MTHPLLEIAAGCRREIEVAGRKMPVSGLGLDAAAAVVLRHPAVRGLFEGEVNVDALLVAAPDAMAEIICRSTGIEPSLENIDAMRRLPAAYQLPVLSAALELTMPDGFAPFIQALGQLLAGLGADVAAKAA